MKENILKSFIKDTYSTTSIIPYFITGQVVVFILLHIFELLKFSGTTSADLYSITIDKLVLPLQIDQFVQQPWSLVTNPFLYTSLWNLLFDCLWLYWIGNMFLNLLNTRQFHTVLLGGLFLGGLLFLIIGLLPIFKDSTLTWSTSAFGLGALLASLTVLTPNSELRLLLLGNIKLKWIAAVYLGLQFAFLVMMNVPAAISYISVVFVGMLFTYHLRRGNDWSLLFKKRNNKLKVVKGNTTNPYHNADKEYPDQQQIDQILDKISLKGYEGLTSKEKELLFRASKKED